MKKIFFALIASLAVMTSAAQQTDHLFPYPVVPESKSTLSERCNYLVYKFWDQCPIKASFSSVAKLDQAFGDWLGFMPYATTDTVNLAIDKYLAEVNRQAPEQMGAVGRMAEKWLYSDSAEYNGENVYLRFVDAMLNAKKVSKAEKARYAAHKQIIESSGVGHQVADLPITLRDGQTVNLRDITANTAVVIYFFDPDCLDCLLAKARLSADLYTNRLIGLGDIKIVAIHPGEATDEWIAATESYPDNWVVGACPDIDEYFSIPGMPTFYVLNDEHVVRGKNLPVDNILYMSNALYDQYGGNFPTPQEAADTIQQEAADPIQ